MLVACVVLLGCGDDDGGEGGGGSQQEGFLDQWASENPDLVEAEYEGQRILVDEGERTVYSDDCDLVDEATSEGHEYGPSEGETGYASICPSGG